MNEMKTFKKALEFYADKDLYKYEISYDMAHLEDGEILLDEGRVARKALKEGTLEEYEKALEFYSNEELYCYDVSYDMAELLYGEILEDEGFTAKVALAHSHKR